MASAIVYGNSREETAMFSPMGGRRTIAAMTASRAGRVTDMTIEDGHVTETRMSIAAGGSRAARRSSKARATARRR